MIPLKKSTPRQHSPPPAPTYINVCCL